MANNPPPSASQPYGQSAVGAMSHPSNFGPPLSMPMNFHPMVPMQQQGQQFMPASSAQFHPGGQNMPPNYVQSQNFHYPQPVQQLHTRPGMPVHPSSSQALPMPYGQPNRPMASSGPPGQQNAPPFGNHMPGTVNQGMPLSSQYMFQPATQMQTPPVPHVVQPWIAAGSQSSSAPAAAPQTGEQSVPTPNAISHSGANTNQQSASDWQEHTSADGRRYYYNKKTRQSSWEKPSELMTPLERADASTVWKEFTTPEGKKYYYNKVTKQSTWSIPEDLKLAREQAEKEAEQGKAAEAVAASYSAASGTVMSTDAPSTPIGSSAPNNSSSQPNLSGVINPAPTQGGGVGVQSPATPVNPPTAEGLLLHGSDNSNNNLPKGNIDNHKTLETANSADTASIPNLEEQGKGMPPAGSVHTSQTESKPVNEEPDLVFVNKQEAKAAFKSLLESVNVQSDWSWDQAMRVIINDKRYTSLKTLGERKQAFNEYLGQRKKLEAEERRVRQKRAKEEFTKMLEESKELTSSTRWSKAVAMFEDDERFKAVERARDREDLFETYLMDLQKKEKLRAQEEQRQNREEFRKFLESCDFIKANSLWRKVQDLLEDDDRCLRLEKIDRLEIFQDYIRDLEREEEEQKKIQKEKTWRIERKNRDQFRKMLEEDIAAGTINAKTRWRDYCGKVKDSSSYLAVAHNTSGSTPKDLFEDAVEELESQYHDEKSRVKDIIKSKKVSIATSWTFEEFKNSIYDDLGSSIISDVNLKLIFEDLLDRIREKEEKEAKRKQRLADDFTDLLHSIKDINVASTWDECKPLVEDSEEFSAIDEETVAQEIFNEYISHLKEKAKEKERKREEEKAKKEKERDEKDKRKEKERKEKDRDRDREKKKDRFKKDEVDSENLDGTDDMEYRDEPKRERDRDREKKHRKRHHETSEDIISSDRDDREESSKKSRRHSGDRKKSRKYDYSPESDSESRYRRHEKDDRDGSKRDAGHEELEDGELGEDGDLQ